MLLYSLAYVIVIFHIYHCTISRSCKIFNKKFVRMQWRKLKANILGIYTYYKYINIKITIELIQFSSQHNVLKFFQDTVECNVEVCYLFYWNCFRKAFNLMKKSRQRKDYKKLDHIIVFLSFLQEKDYPKINKVLN